MGSSVISHHDEIELQDTSPSHRPRLARIGSYSSLQSATVSDRASSEDADDDDDDSGERLANFTADEERVVVKKLDRHLVLFIAFLYMLSFLDRSSKFAVHIAEIPNSSSQNNS